MHVTFMGEGAIDHEGPSRKFFRLLTKGTTSMDHLDATNNVIALRVTKM